MTASSGHGPASPFGLALVGAGRVGTAVAELLRGRGHTIVGVASRSPRSAEHAAERLNATTFQLDPGDLPDADVVLLATPDDALAELVGRFAPVIRPGAVLWHVSGSLGLAPLRPATERGISGCAVHPMQACPSVDAAIANLPGSAWGVTVEPSLREWARRLVGEDLGGVSVEIAEEHRALWHAASITTSTGINAVLAVGEALLAEIGMGDPLDALRPLVQGTLRHSFENGGGRRTVTGPVVRGERETLERHLQMLRALPDQDVLRDYVAVARLVLERAAAAERLTGSVAESMREFLDRAERG